MSISKRERMLVVFVLVLALMCAYYLFFLKPYMEEINGLEIDKSTKQLLVTTNSEQAARINQLDEQIAENEAIVDGYSVMISQGCDQPPMLVYLEETINAHAEKVMFAFADVRQYGALEVTPVTVTMVCSYEGLKDLLSALSEDEYFIKVANLHVAYSAIVEAPEIDDTTGADDTAELDAADTQPPEVVVIGYDLNVTMELEVYNLAGEIPADTVYTFDDDFKEYGGDIFFE